MQLKSKIINTIIPPLFGILTVLAILIVATLIYNRGANLGNLTRSDTNFYFFFVPAAALIAIIIQLILALPVLKRFKSNKKVLGLDLIPFTILVTIICGLAFGIVFWEEPLGTTELLYSSVTGIIAFAIYWTVNLLTVRFFDRRLNSAG